MTTFENATFQGPIISLRLDGPTNWATFPLSNPLIVDTPVKEY